MTEPFWRRSVRSIAVPAALLLSACGLVQPIPSQPQSAPQVEAPVAATPTPSERVSATPQPAPSERASATPQPSVQPAEGITTLEALARVELPIRDQVQLAYEFGRTNTLMRVARTTPLDVQVGDVETFFVSDQERNSNYTIEARLVLALEHVLVYVENGVDLDLAALEGSARQFNDQIYPRNRELFGSEWTPGVDGDPRLTILNARIPGVGGYFSGSDEVPRSVNPFSNEREMFYINIDSYLPGTDEYASVLAHEFQHMIHWNEQRAVPTWFNEGLSQLAEELNGFDATTFAVAYLADPDVQLTSWAEDQAARLPHYAASYLFLSYFYEQYGDLTDLRSLIHANAGYHLEPLAEIARRRHPDITSFSDLYADWAVANLVNDGRYAGGRYHYRHLPTTVQPMPLRGMAREQVAQFGSDYWQFAASDRPRVLRFDGSDQVGLVAATPDGQAMWWSNRGDSTHTSLSRSFDLRNVSSATLHYRLWYDLEENWDYGFVSVSTDGGQTFTPLETRYTTPSDPQGYNYGHAYTGRSGGEPARWIDEQVDLTPFVGQQVIVRFSMITDDAVNRPGLAIDNIRLPEIGFVDDVEQPRDDWTAQGWVRTDNRLPQRWELRLVRIGAQGVTFEEVALDADNRAELRIAPGERGALVISGATPLTTEPASYTLQLEE
ncbi:immune inhibitor A domain-containing protein [Kallotenue papyrolyticum]|uniref:immune inhibitor A domain-containing protein n=1 Tax=Kallotenue papyrolyticum TaxID=1325125 RepID=UPI00047863FE|nr:immune inhibitor A domain-containing protein [Kallotenue papyrolyticum]